MLMVSLTGLLGGILLPYLSHDWEMDCVVVGAKLNLAIKLLGVTMLAGGTLVLLVAPLLFGLALHGKYDGGLQILPWTLTYCAWMVRDPGGPNVSLVRRTGPVAMLCPGGRIDRQRRALPAAAAARWAVRRGLGERRRPIW